MLQVLPAALGDTAHRLRRAVLAVPCRTTVATTGHPRLDAALEGYVTAATATSASVAARTDRTAHALLAAAQEYDELERLLVPPVLR